MSNDPVTFRPSAIELGFLDRLAEIVHADRSSTLRAIVPSGPAFDVFAYQSLAGHTSPREWLAWLEDHVARSAAAIMLHDKRFPLAPDALPVGRPLVVIETYFRWLTAVDAIQDAAFDGGAHAAGALKAIRRKCEWRLVSDGEFWRLAPLEGAS
jgi:hypothetical protein